MMSLTSTFRKTGILLVLVTLLAGLVPAHASRARPRLEAFNFDSTDPVVVPVAAVRDQLWITHANGRAEELQRYELLAFVRILDRLYRQNPALPAETAVQQLQSLQQAYNQRMQTERSRTGRTANETILSVFAVLTAQPFSTSPAYTAVVAAGLDAYHLTLGTSFITAGGAEDRLASAPEMYQQTLSADQAYETILQDALTLAKANSSFGTAFDSLWSTSLQASVYDNAATLIAESQTLRALPDVLALIEPDGTITTTPAELKGLAVTYFAKASQVITESTALMKQQNEGTASKDTIEARVKEIKPLLKEAKDGLPMIAKIVGHVDPWFGEQIKKNGAAVLTVADAALTIVGAIDLVVGAATPLGVIKMVGTIAGALGNVFGLFKEADKPAGPKPEEVILQEIGKLREQVRAMHVEMRQRFDRIDKALNTMYETMVSRFDQIDLQLQVINGDLKEIQTSLVQIQRDLNRIEKNLQAAISDGFEQNLWLDIDGGLGYQERTGEEMHYTPTFVDYESTFFTWATQFASRATYSLPAEGPWDDAAAYDLLRTYPPDKVLNYLAQLPNARWSLPALASTHLPNPRVWAVSSQAYTRLALDWPQWANRMPLWSQRAETIAQRGKLLQDALEKITTIRESSGTQANYALWDQLIANYLWHSTHPDNAQSVAREIQAIETSYLDGLKVGNPNDTGDDRQGHVDPWGGPGQQLAQADIPALDQIARCDLNDHPLAAPSNIKPSLVPTPYLVARYLRLGNIEVCYNAEFTDERRGGHWECVETQPNKPCKNVWVEYCVSSDLWFHVIARFGGQRIGINSNQIYNDGSCEDIGAANNNWTHWKGVIEGQLAQASHADHALLAQVTSDVTTQLRTHQQAVYERVLAGLGAGPLQAAAKRLSGAKALLDSYVALGLPRALEQDEVLRSLLLGTQRLLDEDGERRLTAIYTNARATLPAHNVRVDVTNLMNQKREALKTQLWVYLNRITAGQHVESTRLLEATQDRQRLTRALVKTSVAQVAPSTVDFGRQLAGAGSVARTVTVTNSGMAPLAIGAVSLAGQHSADFTQTGTCEGSLAAGATCAITVTFRPRATGNRNATLSISTSAPNSPQIVTLSGTGTAAAGARNLLTNPGFESAASGVPSQPAAWTRHGAVTRSDAVKLSGSVAMRHQTTKDTSYTISSTGIKDLVPGAPYTFGGWVNIPATTGADATGFTFALSVLWRDAANATIASTPVRSYTTATKGVWTPATARLVAPAGASSAIVRMQVTSLNGTIYVDDLFFGNLLANGGFELDTNVDNRPDGWTTSQYVTLDTATRRSGARAMRHAATNNAGYAIARPTARLAAGARYNLSGYVKIPRTTDSFTFRIEVQWRDAANKVVSTSMVKSFTAHTNSDWSLVNANLTAPTGTASAQVRMVVESLNGTIYVDDLALRP